MAYVRLTTIREDLQIEGVKDFRVTVAIEHNRTKCEHHPHDMTVRVYWNPIPWRDGEEVSHKFWLTFHDGEAYRTTIEWDGGHAVMQGDKHREIARQVWKYSKAMRKAEKERQGQ